jgi:hypothetical protein
VSTLGVIAPKENAQPPRWLVAIVVLVTAAATAFAMTATQLEGPRVAWDEFEQNVKGIWAVPQAPAPLPSAPGWAHPVAGLTAAPAIVAGAAAPHLDRGTCTNCHSVMSPRGTPMPSITASTALPHANVGPCQNCHLVQPSAAGGRGMAGPVAGAPLNGAPVAGAPFAGNPVAGAMVDPNGSPMMPYGSFVAGVQPPAPAIAPPPPAPPQPTEAEWMGLEVAPAKTGTGVVVGGAESVAGRAGMMAGDVISSVNGAKIATMLDFVTVTDNGLLKQGTVIVKRGGQRLAFELGSATSPPAAPTPPPMLPGAVGARPGCALQPAPAPAPPAGMTGAMPGLPPGGSIVGPGSPERRF